jgi:hypothetical protein
MAPFLADHCISKFTVLAVQVPWQYPHMHTTHNPLNSAFHLFYTHSANASACFSAHKSLNPSFYFAAYPILKYGHRVRNPVKGAQDIMIHNVYCTRNLLPSSTEIQPPDKPLSVDPHEIFPHVSTALPDTSADHVLLGDFKFTIPTGEAHV